MCDLPDSIIRRCRAPLFLVTFILLITTTGFAQGSGGQDVMGNGGRHTIQGRIYFPSGQRTDARIKIKLQNIQFGEVVVLADGNGTFAFKALQPGSYTVLVEGGDDYETATESVYIDGDGSNPRSGIVLTTVPRTYQVQIYLQPKRGVANKAGVLNAELAGVPEAARADYEKAIALVQTGDTNKAIEQLKQAIALYPSFPLALNELGVQYLKIGDPAKAVDVLRSAVKLKPEMFTSQLNYGIALLQNKAFAESEKELREAVRRNDTSATAHLYLGISLVHLTKYDEAEQSFVKALDLAGKTTHMAQAHYYLGGIYWRRKAYKQAADELDTYLKQAPNAADASKIRATIADLRGRS